MTQNASRTARLRPMLAADVGTKIQGWMTEVFRETGKVLGYIRSMPKFGQGWALMRVVHQALKEGKWNDSYEQFILFENPGAIVVCVDEADRVGFVRNFRMVGPRPERVLAASRNPETGDLDFACFIQNAVEKGLVTSMIEALGEHVLELPRGLAPGAIGKSTSTSDLNAPLRAFALTVAKIEAKEEAGFDIAEPEICGMVNANTTFFPYSQYVVKARIVARGVAHPETLEKIGGVEMHSKKDIRRLIASGELYDGLSLASLAVADVI